MTDDMADEAVSADKEDDVPNSYIEETSFTLGDILDSSDLADTVEETFEDAAEEAEEEKAEDTAEEAAAEDAEKSEDAE